jgi:hypothetical protein
MEEAAAELKENFGRVDLLASKRGRGVYLVTVKILQVRLNGQ